MSKRTFDRQAEKLLRSGAIKFTTAKHYGTDGIVITNRLVDIDPYDLLLPHLRVRCDKCGALCALHAETLKQAPECDIICAHCAGPIPEHVEVRSNPIALAEMLLHGKGNHKPKGRT